VLTSRIDLTQFVPTPCRLPGSEDSQNTKGHQLDLYFVKIDRTKSCNSPVYRLHVSFLSGGESRYDILKSRSLEPAVALACGAKVVPPPAVFTIGCAVTPVTVSVSPSVVAPVLIAVASVRRLTAMLNSQTPQEEQGYSIIDATLNQIAKASSHSPHPNFC
jgi:hypothetical protein